jgi:hypothetical protein
VLAATAEIPKSLPLTAPPYVTDTAPPLPVATLLLNDVEDENDIGDDETVPPYETETEPPFAAERQSANIDPETLSPLPLTVLE